MDLSSFNLLPGRISRDASGAEISGISKIAEHCLHGETDDGNHHFSIEYNNDITESHYLQTEM